MVNYIEFNNGSRIVIDSNSCIGELVSPSKDKEKVSICKYCKSSYIETTILGECPNCKAFIF